VLNGTGAGKANCHKATGQGTFKGQSLLLEPSGASSAAAGASSTCHCWPLSTHHIQPNLTQPSPTQPNPTTDHNYIKPRHSQEMQPITSHTSRRTSAGFPLLHQLLAGFLPQGVLDSNFA
jgi:hypothetical protein